MVHRSIYSTSTIFKDKHSDFSFQIILFALVMSTIIAFLVQKLTSQTL